MSSDSTQYGPLAPTDIFQIIEMLTFTAINFVVHGFYTTLVCMTLYNLWTRKGVLGARKILILATVIMFICSTASVIETLLFYTVQIPTLGADPPDVDDLITRLIISINAVQRLSLLISDMIVVWRAWVLWTESRTVRVVLSICLSLSIVGTCIDYSFGTAYDLGKREFFPSGPRTLSLSLPTLLTNLISTALIGYKIWLYRRDVKHGLSIAPNKTTRVEKILLLLMESGIIYCVVWLPWMYIGLSTKVDGYAYTLISNLWPQITAIYPILITLLVSMEKMQLEGTIGAASTSTSIHFNSAPGASVQTRGQTNSDINTNTTSLHSDVERGGHHHESDIEEFDRTPTEKHDSISVLGRNSSVHFANQKSE